MIFGALTSGVQNNVRCLLLGQTEFETNAVQ